MSIAAESPNRAVGGASPEDFAAIADVHREFFPRLVRLCARQLRDQSLAEDVAQETVLRALRFWASYDAERPTWPWLKAIALRLCIDAHRARSHEICLEAVPEQAESSDPTDALLDELAVRRAMAGLPERQRLALRLRYLDDRDRAASAQLLGVNVNAFDQLLSRARLRLATAMGPACAGALVGLVGSPLRWLRKRLPGKGRGGLASTALATMTTVPLAVAPLLAIVGGMSPFINGHADTGRPVLSTSQAYVRPAPPSQARPVGATTRTANDTGDTTSVRMLAQAGPASATASVAKHPLGPGRVESHRVRIVTPVSTVSFGGDSDHSPSTDAVCSLPLVECSH
jgi:RNA polymerase sigma-70 factor (ECF subfamily)